jgi:hypothetical protein
MHNKNIELIVLVYLLLSFCVPSTLGIYKNSATSTQSLSTSSWDVSLNQANISPNVTATIGQANGSTYTLKLVNDSEVNVSYSITISNIPSNVDVMINGGSYLTPTNGTVTIPNAGTINYTGSPVEVTRTLTFRANNGASLVNNQQVTIDVDFKQTN